MTSAHADLLNFSAHARVLLSLTAIAWIAHLVNFVLRGGLNWAFGLRPRHFWGLFCIPTSPFLHANADHLTGNTVIFLPLAWFILMQGIHLFYVVTIIITLLSGFSLWLLGERLPQPYIGASDLIFGYLGFLLIYGLTSANPIALILAGVAGFMHLSKITGSQKFASKLLPGSGGASFSHLLGFMAGVLVAYGFSTMRLS
jgi:membrane associated rhomboid family serine protease